MAAQLRRHQGRQGASSPRYVALAKDLLHPSPEEEKRKHKKKRLVQSPNSYFMDPCTNSSFVCWLLYCPLPAYRRKSKAYRRMLFQTEAALKAPCIKMNGRPSQ
ncbi:RPS27 [Cervus elaphus hippelaphus]|uniref:RPS27 n=1 Tax=Cervus elaphus hippelaphus TaxID=46360 RepID=A0A212CGW8_CEREH|nr:RPS27 [Cervus elaphus hippelaphus]